MIYQENVYFLKGTASIFFVVLLLSLKVRFLKYWGAGGRRMEKRENRQETVESLNYMFHLNHLNPMMTPNLSQFSFGFSLYSSSHLRQTN